MNPVESALDTLAGGGRLTAAQSHDAIAMLLDGEASDTTTGALLTGLYIRGETAEQLEGAVRAVRERMIPWKSGVPHDSHLDICGTGGDGAGTVNISTAAAIIVAACGMPVVKHGNRAASGVSGSSDVLAALGVEADADLAVLARCLTELRIAFLFAPKFHLGLQRIASIRRQLPFRTVFNLVGPLCNPASPGYQLIGAPDELKGGMLAEVLSRQPHIRRAVVVSGSDGLDEVTLDGPTAVWVVEPGQIGRRAWVPEDFGLSRQNAATLRVRDAIESATRIKRAFSGEHGPLRDYLLANSAAALWTTGRVSIRDGVAMAATAVDSGAASRLVTRWSEIAPATPLER